MNRINKKLLVTILILIAALMGACDIDPKVASPNNTIVCDQLEKVEISNREDLESVALGPDSAGYCYELTGDIALNNTPWVPLGSESNPFLGILDGGEFIISGLTITQATTDYIGIFAQIGSSSQISPPQIYDLTISVAPAGITGKDYVGALAGNSYASINNVQIIGSFVKGANRVGGMIGAHAESTIESSSSEVEVMTSNSTDISSGGLIGELTNGTIKDSTASGDLNTARQTGGLVGSMNASSIQDSSATGTVSGGQTVGGLVGFSQNNSTIQGSSANGAVSSTEGNTGGLVGHFQGGGIITNSSVTGPGTVSGQYHNVGGLVGYLEEGSITDSSVTGKDITATTNDAGGLVGHLKVGTIANSFYTTGTIRAQNNVGGLVGLLGSTDINDGSASISTSFSSATVRNGGGGAQMGGLLGANLEGGDTISDSYATGSVGDTGANASKVGGLIGSAKFTLKVANSYATGRVSGPGTATNLGGLVGEYISTEAITNSYYDSTTTGQTQGVGSGTPADAPGVVTGYTITDLTAVTAFDGIADASDDWNFATIWSFTADQWPTLKWQQNL